MKYNKNKQKELTDEQKAAAYGALKKAIGIVYDNGLRRFEDFVAIMASRAPEKTFRSRSLLRSAWAHAQEHGLDELEDISRAEANAVLDKLEQEYHEYLKEQEKANDDGLGLSGNTGGGSTEAQGGVHSSFVSDVSLYSETGTLALDTAKGAGKVGAVGLTDHVLAKFLEDCKRAKATSSKEVDENGEPLASAFGDANSDIQLSVADDRGQEIARKLDSITPEQENRIVGALGVAIRALSKSGIRRFDEFARAVFEQCDKPEKQFPALRLFLRSAWTRAEDAGVELDELPSRAEANAVLDKLEQEYRDYQEKANDDGLGLSGNTGEGSTEAQGGVQTGGEPTEVQAGNASGGGSVDSGASAETGVRGSNRADGQGGAVQGSEVASSVPGGRGKAGGGNAGGKKDSGKASGKGSVGEETSGKPQDT